MGAGLYSHFSRVKRERYDEAHKFHKLLSRMVMPKCVTGVEPAKTVKYWENGLITLETIEWTVVENDKKEWAETTYVDGNNYTIRELPKKAYINEKDMERVEKPCKYDSDYVYGNAYGDYTFKSFECLIV